MNIHIEFLAQLGQLAGGKHRTIAFDGPCTAQDALRQTIAEDTEEFRALLRHRARRIHTNFHDNRPP